MTSPSRSRASSSASIAPSEAAPQKPTSYKPTIAIALGIIVSLTCIIMGSCAIHGCPGVSGLGTTGGGCFVGIGGALGTGSFIAGCILLVKETDAPRDGAEDDDAVDSRRSSARSDSSSPLFSAKSAAAAKATGAKGAKASSRPIFDIPAHARNAYGTASAAVAAPADNADAAASTGASPASRAKGAKASSRPIFDIPAHARNAYGTGSAAFAAAADDADAAAAVAAAADDSDGAAAPPPPKSNKKPPRSAAQAKHASVFVNPPRDLSQYARQIVRTQSDCVNYGVCQNLAPATRDVLMPTNVQVGNRYPLTQRDIEILKNDKEFMLAYRHGIEKLLDEWNIDISGAPRLLAAGQDEFNRLPIAQLLHSLKLFDQNDTHAGLLKYMNTNKIVLAPQRTFDVTPMAAAKPKLVAALAAAAESEDDEDDAIPAAAAAAPSVSSKAKVVVQDDTDDSGSDVDDAPPKKAKRAPPHAAAAKSAPEHTRKTQELKMSQSIERAMLESPGAPVKDHFNPVMLPRTKDAVNKEFALNAREIQALQADPDFMRSYVRGVGLIATHWGWDLSKPPPERMDWSLWQAKRNEARLAQMIHSLDTFKDHPDVAPLHANLTAHIRALGEKGFAFSAAYKYAYNHLAD